MKPCPFCSGAACLLTTGPVMGMPGSQTWEVYVECISCGARGPMLVDGAYQPDDRRKLAVEGWDCRRA